MTNSDLFNILYQEIDDTKEFVIKFLLFTNKEIGIANFNNFLNNSDIVNDFNCILKAYKINFNNKHQQNQYTIEFLPTCIIHNQLPLDIHLHVKNSLEDDNDGA
jgi:hypothetical protein